MGFEKYSRRIVNKMNTDVLVIYHRISNKDEERVNLDWEDISAITELIQDYKSKEGSKDNKNLIILIQTQGGVFQCAFPLMKKLKEIYKDGQIKSTVFTISKSSGAFVALSTCETYMDNDACISNFSMNDHMQVDAQQAMSYVLEAQDIYINKNNDTPLPNLLNQFRSLSNNDEHAKDILFTEASTKYGVKSISEFGEGDWHLQEIANFIKYEFDEQKSMKKIIGFNGEFIHFPQEL